jgi:hypothetical protein
VEAHTMEDGERKGTATAPAGPLVFDWQGALPWRCPRCGAEVCCAELAPRCERCGYREAGD